MLSLGSLILIAVIVLLVVGPSRLPKMGLTLGQSIRDFKKSLNGTPDVDITDTVKKDDAG